MNCTTWQQWILLNTSSELSPRRSRKLQQHLNTCETCRAFEQELCTLSNHASPTEETLAISDFAITRILQEGAAQRAIATNTARPHVVFRPALIYSAAIAALLMLFFGWKLLNQPPHPSSLASNENTSEILAWNDNWDDEFSQLETSFELVYIDLENTGSDNDPYDTELLAQQLLTMEES